MLGRENGRIFLKAAFGEIGNRRNKRFFLGAAANEGLLDLIYLNFEEGIEASLNVGPPLNTMTALGDGVVLDWFSKFGKWVIEHQDEILAFIKAIFSIFSGV